MLQSESLCHWQIGLQTRERFVGCRCAPAAPPARVGEWGAALRMAPCGDTARRDLAQGQGQPAQHYFYQIAVQFIKFLSTSMEVPQADCHLHLPEEWGALEACCQHSAEPQAGRGGQGP